VKGERQMTTPRTVAGQAALSATKPWVRRALGPTIVSIETEAAAPYVEALRRADRVLESLAMRDATSDWDTSSKAGLVARAEAAHRLVGQVLSGDIQESREDHE
jgi:hypothetical protein